MYNACFCWLENYLEVVCASFAWNYLMSEYVSQPLCKHSALALKNFNRPKHKAQVWIRAKLQHFFRVVKQPGCYKFRVEYSNEKYSWAQSCNQDFRNLWYNAIINCKEEYIKE